MERVVDILRALLSRALREHERAPSALTNITIVRARGRFPPRLEAQFSNGYRTGATLGPSDCYAFCERHSAWDLKSLRCALLGEAQRMYAQMLENYVIDLRLRRRRAEEFWRTREPRRMNRFFSWIDFQRRSLFGDDGATLDVDLLLARKMRRAQR